MNVEILEKRREELEKELERVETMIDHQKKNEKKFFEGHPSQTAHRKIRTVAKALLDLYDALGERPKQRNALMVVAERDE